MGSGRMVLGAIIGLGLMLSGMFLEGGHLSALLSVPAFAMVVGGTAGFLVMGYPVRVQMRSIKLVLTPRPIARAELQVARLYFSAMGAGFLMFGILSVVIGLIHVMANLEKPELIGPGIALAFTGIFYGFLLRIFVANVCGDAVAVQIADESAATSATMITHTETKSAV